MAVTVVANLTTIWDCESVTGAVGNKPALETEIFLQGSNSVDFTTSQTNTVAGYNGTIPNSGDLSGQHIRIWYTSITFPNMDSEVNHGMVFYASDGTNTSYWEIAGKDTYQGGWINVLVYIDSTPDSTSGTAASTTAITELGIRHRSGTGGTSDTYLTRPKNLINVWVDYFRFGDGVTAYGTAWGIDDVYLADNTSGVAYGIVGFKDKPYFIYGDMTFGRTTEQTTYTDSGVQIVFADANVNPGTYGINFIGDTAVSSTFSLTGSVISTALEPFYLNFDDTNIASLTFTGNTVQGASTSHFLASSTLATVTGNVFDTCGIVYPQGSKFENITITNTSVTGTDGSVYLTDATTVTNMKNITFSNYTGKYAVHIPASVTGSITLDNWLFDGSGTDVYWAGTSGTLTVNLTNGSDATTSATGGGTVSFVSNPVTTTIKVIDTNTKANLSGARVYLIADTGGPLTAGTVIISGVTDVNGEISDTRSIASNQPVKGRVRLSTTAPFYKNSSVVGVINNLSGLSLTIQMIPDQ